LKEAGMNELMAIQTQKSKMLEESFDEDLFKDMVGGGPLPNGVFNIDFKKNENCTNIIIPEIENQGLEVIILGLLAIKKNMTQFG